MFRDSVARCLSLLPRGLRVRWGMLVGLATVAAAAEMVSAATIFSTIALLGDPGATYGRWPKVIASIVARASLQDAAGDGGARARRRRPAREERDHGGDAGASRPRHGRFDRRSRFRQVVAAILSVPYAVHLGRHLGASSHATIAVDTAYRIVLASAVSVDRRGPGRGRACGGDPEIRAVCLPIAAIAVVGVLLAALAFATRNETLQMGRDDVRLAESRCWASCSRLPAVSRRSRRSGARRTSPTVSTPTNHRFTNALKRHVIALPMPRVIIESAFVAMSLVVVALVGGTSDRLLPLFALFAYAGFRMIPAMNRIVFHLDEIRHGRRAVEQLTTGVMNESAQIQPSDGRLRPPVRRSDRGSEPRVSPSRHGAGGTRERHDDDPPRRVGRTRRQDRSGKDDAAPAAGRNSHADRRHDRGRMGPR